MDLDLDEVTAEDATIHKTYANLPPRLLALLRVRTQCLDRLRTRCFKSAWDARPASTYISVTLSKALGVRAKKTAT
jgi:hypothetical protein